MESIKNEIKLMFEKYSRRIVLFCNSITKNMEEAEDITIDVFVELWKRINNFETEDKAKAFLFITAKHKCLNYLNCKKIVTCELTDYAEINTIVMDNIYEHMIEEVEKLPVRQRTIIKSYLSGLKASEIAMKMGISLKTVCNVKAIAENSLRLKLKMFI